MGDGKVQGGIITAWLWDSLMEGTEQVRGKQTEVNSEDLA